MLQQEMRFESTKTAINEDLSERLRLQNPEIQYNARLLPLVVSRIIPSFFVSVLGATCSERGSPPTLPTAAYEAATRLLRRQSLVEHEQALGQHADIGQNFVVEVVHHDFEVVVALLVNG